MSSLPPVSTLEQLQEEPRGLQKWLQDTFGTPSNLLMTVGAVALVGTAAGIFLSSMKEDSEDEEDEEQVDADVAKKIRMKNTLAELGADDDDLEESSTPNKPRRKKHHQSEKHAPEVHLAPPSPTGASASSSAAAAAAAAAAESTSHDEASSPTGKSPNKKKKHHKKRSSNVAPGAAAAASSSTGSPSHDAELRFPPVSASRDVRRYENIGAGFCLDYPHLWKKEVTNTPHIPVKFTCRKKGAKREDSKHAPAVIVSVDKVVESFDLTQAKVLLQQRFGEHQVGPNEDFTLPVYAGEDAAFAGDTPVPAVLCVHDVFFDSGSGPAQPFRQWTMVALRCRKSVTLQLVMPREIVNEYSSEIRLFKNMCRSLYIAPTLLQLDLSIADMFEFTDPEFNFSLSFPAVFRHFVRPKPGVLLSLSREDASDEEKQYGQAIEFRMVPLKAGATLDEFAASARKVVSSATSWSESSTPFQLGSLSGRKNVGVQEQEGVYISQVCVSYSANRGFLITLTCPLDDEREFEQVSKYILDSFKLNEAAAAASSPAVAPTPSDVWLRFNSPTRFIKASLPSTWKTCEDAGQGSIAASFVKLEAGDVPEALHSQVFIHRLQKPEGVTTAQQLEQWIRKQQDSTSQRPFQWSGERSVQWDGRDAREFSAYASMEGCSVRLLFRCAVLDKDQATYLQFASLDDAWSSSLPEVQRIFDSVHLGLQDEQQAASAEGATSAASE